MKNKILKKYKQKLESSDSSFRYEYWWVTNNNIYGYRLMRVRIPPSKGVCSDWKYEFMTLMHLSDSEPIETTYPFEDMKKWSWDKYIKKPIIKD